GSCPGHDVALVGRECEQPVKTFQHFADMEGGRERSAARHVLVEMGDVGSENDKSAVVLTRTNCSPAEWPPTASARKPLARLYHHSVTDTVCRLTAPCAKPATALATSSIMRTPTVIHTVPPAPRRPLLQWQTRPSCLHWSA